MQFNLDLVVRLAALESDCPEVGEPPSGSGDSMGKLWRWQHDPLPQSNQ